MSTYAEKAMGGVFPDHVHRLEIIVRTMRDDHWPEDLQKMFDLLRGYFVLTAGVPRPQDWKNMLDNSGMEPAVVEGFLRIYLKLWQLPPLLDHEWRYALDVMRKDRSKELLMRGLTDSMRVLTEGVSTGKGERAFGYDDARLMLQQRMSDIESLQMDADSTPEGDVRTESDAVWEDYQKRKVDGQHKGVFTGLNTLDDLTYGAQRGEFWLVAAYAGHGKSQTLTNMAWQAVVTGHNVVYFTLETLRDQVIRRFHTRHSSYEQFGQPEGLKYDDIKGGSLSADGEALYRMVLDDLKDNGRYGSFDVIWTPRGTSPSKLKMKLDLLETQKQIDLVVVDYAGLMGPDRRTETRQMGLVEILQGLKGLATGHGRGHGVPLISAYQTSRQRLEDARGSGGYTLDALAETAEAERSADLVMTLLRQNDEDTDVFAQVLKYRDGGTAEFYMETDFARSLVRDRTEHAIARFGGLI